MGLQRRIRATVSRMTYIPSHTAASHFAESHGCDDYTMIPMDDPAEAPNKIYRLRMGELVHPMKKAPVAQAGA